eukprot:2352169-Amphidinium_carterae.1
MRTRRTTTNTSSATPTSPLKVADLRSTASTTTTLASPQNLPSVRCSTPEGMSTTNHDLGAFLDLLWTLGKQLRNKFTVRPYSQLSTSAQSFVSLAMTSASCLVQNSYKQCANRVDNLGRHVLWQAASVGPKSEPASEAVLWSQ